MKIERHGSALWYGGFPQGRGSLSTESAALDDHYYNVASRFDRHVGSNPEELLAAAHAGCFNMVLAMVLAEAHLTATELQTSATVVLEQQFSGFVIASVHLSVRAVVPDADPLVFRRLAAWRGPSARCHACSTPWSRSRRSCRVIGVLFGSPLSPGPDRELGQVPLGMSWFKA